MSDPAAPGLTGREQEIVAQADRLGRGVVAENAMAIDRGHLSVAANLGALVAAGLGSITVPRAYGGAGVSKVAYLRVLEGLAYGDGTTPFTIAQHYGTALMLGGSANDKLRGEALPRMARGELLAGFGIAHVRRQGRPALAASAHNDGYLLDGAVPWMTGYGLFSHAVIAGTLPGGDALLAWVPFERSERLEITEPMDLSAMNGARTVSATCRGVEVRPESVVSIEPAGQRAGANTTTVPCLYGLARACIDDLASLAETRNAPASAAAATRLRERLDRQRTAFYRFVAQPEGAEEELAQIRAGATRLAVDAAVALVIATGGSGNGATHPAQRRLREASIFATWGLSPAAVDAAVTSLAADG